MKRKLAVPFLTRKTCMLFFFSFITILSAKTQVTFYEDFDNISGPTAGGAGTYTFPSGWLLRNVDNRTPDAQVSYVNEAWERREDFGHNVIDSVAFSTSFYSPTGTADDWMWTPLIGPLPANSVLTWNALAYDPAYPDGYEVRIMESTQGPPTGGTGVLGNQVTNSTVVFSTTAANTSWTSKSVNLDAYTGKSIYIGFRNKSNDQFLLAIDDVKVEALFDHDAGVTDFTKYEYSQTPLSQALSVPLGGTIKNFGGQDLINMRLKAEIYNGANVLVYSASSPATNINSAASSTLSIPAWSPVEPGNYRIKYFPQATETDQATDNDTAWTSFVVTDSVYARDQGTIAGQIGIGAGNGYIGQTFTISRPADLSSIAVTYTRGYTGKRYGLAVWNMTSTGVPDAIIAATDTLLYPSDDLLVDTLPISGGKITLAPGDYVVTAIEFDSTLAVAQTNDIFTPGKVWAGWVQNPQGDFWGNVEEFGGSFQKPFYLRPNLHSDLFITGGSQTNVSCKGGHDGTATVYASGGTAPYYYNWSPSGGTSATATGLTANTYTVTVTDSKGTHVTKNFTITEPTALKFNGSQTNLTCYGINTGSATVSPTGATAPYRYTWLPLIDTIETITGLSAGSYIATITDLNGCALDTTFVITSPAAVVVTGVDAPINGIYAAGNDLYFKVTYNQAVTVNITSGIPALLLTLNTGGIKQASYVSGSGTSELVFHYVVDIADQDIDGIEVDNNIALNGGVIQSTSGCFAVDTLYNLPSTSGVIINNLVDQTITFTDVNTVYGTADFDPGATTSSSLPVTYSIADNTIAIIVNDQLHILKAGSTTITAHQPGDEHYEAAPDKTVNLVVAPLAITVTADVKNKVYGDVDPPLTYTVFPSLINGDTFSGTLSRASGEDVGTYDINQNTLLLNDNYQLTYAGADLTIDKKTITVTADAQSKTYGDTDPALTYSVSPSLVNGDSFTGVLSRATGEDIGAYAIDQNTLSLSNNYQLNYTGADLTIDKKTITVMVDAQSKTYGDTDPDLTYSVSPSLVNGDSFTGVLSRAAGENAGAYAINQNTLSLSNNYQLSYTGADLTINKAVLTVTASNQTVCKDGTIGDITLNYSGFKNGEDETALTTMPTVNRPSTHTTGTFALTPTGGSAMNYNFDYVSGQLIVSALPTGNITQTATGSGVVAGYELTAPAGTSYNWSTGATSASIVTRASGNYSVQVTDAQGCSNSFSVQVALNEVSVPNTFSPNGDGINDYWIVPELVNYPNAYVVIVNREGQIVFESKNFTRWDGRYKGNALPAGVYFYRIRRSVDAKPVTGWLNLVR